ncbi:MAG: CBS domain-containing protein [Hyphomicrobiales bacterium]|nr:CBS domain-containing protein [Hyphomicrobiales bacterium]
MSDTSFIRVGDVMTASPHVIDGLASVRTAIEMMRKEHVSSLVIDRRHDGDEYGVLSVRDIAEKVIGTDRSIDRTSVYEVMSKPVLTVSTEMNIKYAIRLLTRYRLTRALVTEKGVMVGIVTLRDMAVRYIDVHENSGE